MCVEAVSCISICFRRLTSPFCLCTFARFPNLYKVKHHSAEKVQIPPQITPPCILNPFLWHLSGLRDRLLNCFFTPSPHTLVFRTQAAQREQ